MKACADLYALPEDERIQAIAETAAAGHVVGFIVEDDGKKADRYTAKLTRYPVRVIDRGPGPVPNTVLVRVGHGGA